MSTPEEDRKQMEQTAWLLVALIALMAMLIFAGMMDQWLFDGEFFGRK